MIYQKMVERPHNINGRETTKTRILNNFKSFIKQVYQKEWTQNINKKKDQNNYFRTEISQKEEQLLTLKEIKQNDF